MKKSWNDKLQQEKAHTIKSLNIDISDMKKGQKMLIATPKIIDEYINNIPNGTDVDVKTLRKDLAIAHGADTTCPLTTGIFLRIVSEAAYENWAKGKKNITPFWRVIHESSKIAKKLACGIPFIEQQRKKEGLY